MSKQHVVGVFALCGALAVGGCHADGVTNTCGDNLVAYDPSLEVTVKDSVSGALVANATITMIPEVPADSVRKEIGSDVTAYPAWFARWGGTSTIAVSADGYMPLSETVTYSRACVPLRASLTILLHRVF